MNEKNREPVKRGSEKGGRRRAAKGKGVKARLVDHHEFPQHHEDPLIRRCTAIIRYAVRVLAVLMVAVIIWGVIDVGWVLYRRLSQPPYFLLNISDILATFGAFLAVLIAIEIFINIILYLRDDVIHVKLVTATALMAVARKVIVLDYKQVGAEYVFATGAVVLALGIAYWLVSMKTQD